MKYDVVIIGAGASGMALGALLHKREPRQKIAILEAHSLPGGCSSYFERSGFCFDAGATTLSGLAPNRPLNKLLSELDIQLDLRKIDPGIVSIIANKKIHFYSDHEKQIQELKNNFTNLNPEIFWNKILKISELGWSASSSFSKIPLYSLSDLSQFVTMDSIQYLKLLPILNQSVEKLLSESERKNPDYIKLINELLFITAQNNMQNTPALMGAMGLTYASDTYYSMGGMKTFSQALASKCQKIFYQHRVLEIKKQNDLFEISTNKGLFQATKVVSSLPVWNNGKILKDIALDEPVNDEECWSAFMLYFTIPTTNEFESLYYQIHTDKPIPYCDTHSFFVSLSHPDDQLRQPSTNINRQTVTISTHTRAKVWENLSTEEYQKRKNILADFIIKEFSQAMRVDSLKIENLITGSPKSFIRFTGRHRGLVGGIPHSIHRNLPAQIFAPSPIHNFFMIGDTQFPGQGIAAVVRGAMALADHLGKN
jgi:phytoene dehydrogenase-like protein